MAVTARRLRRLETWSNWQAAGGTRQSVVDDAIAARASITIANEQLTVTLPIDSPAIPSLAARKVIRIDQSDACVNYALQSENLADAVWNKRGTAGVAGKPDPFGGTNAFEKVIGASGTEDMWQSVSGFGASVKMGASIWMKIIVQGTGVLRVDNPALSGVNFYNVPALTTGQWQRIQGYTLSTAAGASGLYFYSTGTGWTVQFYGGQLEIGALTNYIKTTTVPVTVDAVFDEYKITERAVDDAQGVWSITATPLRLNDLAGCGLISRKDSDGVVVYDFEVLGLTPTELITNWVLPALSAAGFGWISVGNITPTARMDMTFAWDTPLSVLLRIASSSQSEIDLRRNGSVGYFIDIVSNINSNAQQADIRIDKNLVNVARVESSVDQATRIFPKGSAQDGMAGTMARARWLVGSVTTRTVNQLTFANDIANAAWSKSGSLGAVLNAVGIDGVANRATTLTDSDPATFQNAAQSKAIANDNATHTASVYFAKDTLQNRFPQVKLVLSGGTTVQRAVAINTATGATSLHNTSGTGTFRVVDGATVHPLLSGWWIMELTCTNNTTGNTTATVSIYPAAGITLGADDVAGVGSCIIGLAQLELNTSAYGPPIITAGSAITSTDIALSDPAGGAGAIGFNNQLMFAYLRKVDGTLVQIDASVASTDVVTVMGNTGITAGDLIEVRADAAGADLTYLDNPAAVVTYGIKVAIRDVSDVPPTNNLIKNPVMRTWPGTLPTNWTAVNAPTTAKQTAAPFTVLGGASIKVTSTTDGQGVVSDAVNIFPTAANPYVSGFAKIWVASGNARVELVFTTAGGPVVWPVAPNVASATVLGQWLDLGASGFDANKIAATAVALRVVQQSTLASVFYVDAAQVTSTPSQMPFFDGSGAVRLWQEANAALVSGSTPVASYTVPLADLEAVDPVTWSESALIIGANARIVDPRLSIDLVTRIVGIERDYMQPENIAITLSNKPQDLTDIMATVSRPDRAPGDSDTPLTNPQQPKLVASFDINGQLIINSYGDNDVVSQKIAWATGSAPSAATVRAATAINQQNVSGLATGSIYAQGTTVFIAAFAYNARSFESSPLVVVSESRQGAIIDYTPFASTLAPIAILSSLPGTGAFVGQIVFLTTDKKLYRWDGSSWLTAVAAADITGQINSAQIAAGAVIAGKIGADAVTAAEIAASAVGNSELAAGAVTAAKITALTITAAEIAAGTITAAKIAANTITAGQIAASTITATEIAALTITGAKIAAGTITADKLVANSITAGQIQAGAITATEIASGAITTAKIAAGAVTANEISANTITAAKIVAGTITTTELAPITVACSLHDTTTPTIVSGTVNAMSWNTSDYDPTGRQSGTSIICDVTGGLVIVMATIRWPSSNTLGTRRLRLYKNGSQFMEELFATRSTYNAGEFWQSYTWYDWNPTSGDAYQIGPMQDSGSTIAVEGKRFTFIHLKI